MFHFEWDPRKALSNWWKRRVTFEEAVEAFSDPLSLTEQDDRHAGEPRFFTIGRSSQAHILVVVHTDDSETVRIISARRATTRERKDYEDGEER
jgi:uncharacterized DUF497 family protein